MERKEGLVSLHFPSLQTRGICFFFYRNVDNRIRVYKQGFFVAGMESKTRRNSQRKNTRSSTKSKFSSVDIIRDNQPQNFRQNNEPQIDDDNVWEEASLPPSSSFSSSISQNPNNVDNFNDNDGRSNQIQGQGLTIEFDTLPDSSKKKRIRRSTAHDKELAELVHKAHLLCLIARGRLIDAACDDPLIQAALLSLVPQHLLKISEAAKLTSKALTPLVSWFHQHFHVRDSCGAEKPFHSALASALEMGGGNSEELAALSVALFRALNLTTRFVSILDASSLKPEADREDLLNMDADRVGKDIFDSSTLTVSKMDMEGVDKSSRSSGKNIHAASISTESENEPGHSSGSVEVKESLVAESAGQTENASQKDQCPRKKGDMEFEMQLEMALSATALANPKMTPPADNNDFQSGLSKFSSPSKKLKRIIEVSSSSSNIISTAIGSKKVGAPLYWAEVYCSGENMSGKWVHVDAVNLIVDGEMKVEDAATACKRSLRYVVAFAGHGAKDVTHRYCTKWYKISPKRVNSEWWDSVLSPLTELESRATGGMVSSHPQEMNSMCADGKDPGGSSSIASRSTLEDIELATRALTEPLPTNQQAYRSHPLYAIEKWLTKYQILHPKGPILGFCSGHAVYPRTCVQKLHTKERWLREGLQIKANELPAKMVKSTYKNQRGQMIEVEGSVDSESDSDGMIPLFGKWQTEPLCLPPAVNGIVPKNERGQVDVWSEKCLPPGTVHLRLPRLVPVVKRLGINFAPAMVGFEFRNGHSVPVYEGLVVCTEFREAILEAYAEEEQKREEEEKRRDERQAISRWYQLLSSLVTRQRLNESYRDDLCSDITPDPVKPKEATSPKVTSTMNESSKSDRENNLKTKVYDSSRMQYQNHEHVFVTDDESFDEESMTRTKRCHCGFSIQVEEL